jgi:hypothetical protein
MVAARRSLFEAPVPPFLVDWGVLGAMAALACAHCVGMRRAKSRLLHARSPGSSSNPIPPRAEFAVCERARGAWTSVPGFFRLRLRSNRPRLTSAGSLPVQPRRAPEGACRARTAPGLHQIRLSLRDLPFTAPSPLVVLVWAKTTRPTTRASLSQLRSSSLSKTRAQQNVVRY